MRVGGVVAGIQVVDQHASRTLGGKQQAAGRVQSHVIDTAFVADLRLRLLLVGEGLGEGALLAVVQLYAYVDGANRPGGGDHFQGFGVEHLV